MKRVTQKLIWVMPVMSIVFVMYYPCSAQDNRNKTDSRPEQSVLRRLHPEPVESDPPKGIGLLAGYKHKSATDFEGNQVGEISKPDGVKIKYEMGLSQGMAVDVDQRAAYIWYRDQEVNGRVTRYALNKSNVLVISIPLSKDPNSLHVANFYGAIKKPQDIADMLLIVLPYAYN
jgi:hypothetical protein